MNKPPFVAIKLRAGWRFDREQGLLLGRGECVAPSLPAGVSLVPALELPAAHPPTAAERALGRYLHLLAAEGTSLDEALALARRWSFVESAAIVDE